MTIPYYIFLIIYILIFLGMMVYAFFNFYHIFKFGFFDFTGKLNTILVMGIFLVVLGFTIFFLKDIQWMEGVTLWDSTSFDFNSLSNS